MFQANRNDLPAAVSTGPKKAKVSPDWRPMADFDPSKPALVHDKLDDRVIDWQPERYQRHYQAFAMPLAPGVIHWDDRLLDGWMEPQRPQPARSRP
jgi:hypothetical protein